MVATKRETGKGKGKQNFTYMEKRDERYISRAPTLAKYQGPRGTNSPKSYCTVRDRYKYLPLDY